MTDDSDWLSAHEVFHLVSSQMALGKTAEAICTRAYSGMLRARADRLMKNREVLDDVEVPRSFWWAEGNAALKQNWVTGDFETRIDDRYTAKAFGARFHRDDLRKMLPNVPRLNALALMITGAEALRMMSDACRDAAEAARILFQHARVGGLTVGARFIRVEDEDGEASVEKDRRLKADDWRGIDEPSPEDLTAGILSGSYWDAQERLRVTVQVVGIQFEPSGVAALASSLAANKASNSEQLTPTAQRGRPLAEWWDDLLIEVFRRLWEDSWQPRTKAELVDAMEQWLMDNPGDDPQRPRTAGETALKARAKKIYDVLDLGQKIP